MNNLAEIGKRCQCCYKYRESHRYYHKVRAITGKDKEPRFRRLCRECWRELAEKGKI